MVKLVDNTDLIELIECFHGNLLGENFRIQGNPGINLELRM